VNSLILNTATRVLAPILLGFSIFVLWRGHNDPGGGFIGGLIAATSVALVEKAAGLERAKRMVMVDPLTLSACGLGCALVSAVWGAVEKGYVLAGVWPYLKMVDGHKEGLPVGSILLFDTGVYLVVVGGVCGMLFALESVAGQPAKGEED